MSDSDGPLILGLFGIGDDRVPARVDLEEELELAAVVDRMELCAGLLFGQLLLLGLFTELAATAQVGLAGLVVVVLDVLDRKLLRRRANGAGSAAVGPEGDEGADGDEHGPGGQSLRRVTGRGQGAEGGQSAPETAGERDVPGSAFEWAAPVAAVVDRREADDGGGERANQ
jgi:hypothetical protein